MFHISAGLQDKPLQKYGTVGTTEDSVWFKMLVMGPRLCVSFERKGKYLSGMVDVKKKKIISQNKSMKISSGK